MGGDTRVFGSLGFPPPYLHPPVIWTMAGLTIVLLSRMLRFVAGKTARVFHEIGMRGLPGIGILLFMTRATFSDRSVLPQKGIPCLCMIEVFDIQKHKFCVISFMLSVADRTIFGLVPVVSTVGQDS